MPDDKKIRLLISDAKRTKELLFVAVKNANRLIDEISSSIDLMMSVWETEKAKIETEELSKMVDEISAGFDDFPENNVKDLSVIIRGLPKPPADKN